MEIKINEIRNKEAKKKFHQTYMPTFSARQTLTSNQTNHSFHRFKQIVAENRKMKSAP